MSVYTMEVVEVDGVEEGRGRGSVEWHDSFYTSIDDDGAYGDDGAYDDGGAYDDDGANDEEGYAGCYVDEKGEGRIMKYKSAASDNMTVGRCRAFCEDSRVFGVEYGEE